ncbi:hypothetical protein AVEN_143289-1 [Araneus ventricosus]|uniref:Uncharacterized protein n=1 Tax=Araneus ventricosus TaxID=182803 RepID=A0A4Y2AG84_ARAVE|nr:hypothetical protein AVEN_143289-1 [Araneus ventricosus]
MFSLPANTVPTRKESNTFHFSRRPQANCTWWSLRRLPEDNSCKQKATSMHRNKYLSERALGSAMRRLAVKYSFMSHLYSSCGEEGQEPSHGRS